MIVSFLLMFWFKTWPDTNEYCLLYIIFAISNLAKVYIKKKTNVLFLQDVMFCFYNNAL